MQDLNDFIEFLLYEKGEDLSINNTTNRALIEDFADKTLGTDYKVIKTQAIIRSGDLIFYQDKNWMIFNEVDENENYYKATIRRCKAIKFNNNEYSALVDNKIFDVETDKYMQLVDNQILITIKTIDIDINDIVYFNNKAYKVIAVDDTKDNILILRADYDMGNTHVYTISIDNTTTEIIKGNTLQLNCICKDNNISVTNPTLTYTSSNPSIATINSSGLITSISEGATTITVTYNNVISTIGITVKSIPVTDVWSMSIVGEDSIISSMTSEYVIKFYKNGTEITTDKTVVWSLDNSNARINSSTGVSCIVEGVNDYTNCILTATCSEMNLTTTKNISVDGWF